MEMKDRNDRPIRSSDRFATTGNASGITADDKIYFRGTSAGD